MNYLFWDFNGTILDDTALCHEILNEMLTIEKRPLISLEDYLMIFTFPVIDYYKIVYDLNKTSFDVLAKRFISAYQPRSLSLDLHQDIVETILYFKHKGYKNILLSASEVKNLQEQLNHYQIKDLFDDVLGTSDIYATSKIEVGRSYMEVKRIDPKSCLMIGDTIHDAEVANALGMSVIIYTKGHQHPSRLKKYQNVDNFKQLIGKIEEKGEE